MSAVGAQLQRAGIQGDGPVIETGDNPPVLERRSVARVSQPAPFAAPYVTGKGMIRLAGAR